MTQAEKRKMEALQREGFDEDEARRILAGKDPKPGVAEGLVMAGKGLGSGAALIALLALCAGLFFFGARLIYEAARFGWELVA